MEPDWPGITDAQWNRIKDVLYWYTIPPDRRRKRKRPGRPRVPDKKVFEAILWAMGGGTLDRLPRRFGSQKTVRRRLREWAPRNGAQALWDFYLEFLSPEEACRWAIRLGRKPRRMPFWQELFTISFRIAHPDPFTRLAECQRTSAERARISTPPSSMPESSSPASSGP